MFAIHDTRSVEVPVLLYITFALMICLICSFVHVPLELHIRTHIRQVPHAHVTTFA